MLKAIYSLVKDLDILFSFNFKDKSLSAQTISERLDIPLRTTYRYLETLKKRGILARYGVTGNCELGFALFKLGHIVPSQMKLTEIVQPYIQRVCGDFGHTGSNESTG